MGEILRVDLTVSEDRRTVDLRYSDELWDRRNKDDVDIDNQTPQEVANKFSDALSFTIRRRIDSSTTIDGESARNFSYIDQGTYYINGEIIPKDVALSEHREEMKELTKGIGPGTEEEVFQRYVVDSRRDAYIRDRDGHFHFSGDGTHIITPTRRDQTQ